MSDVIDVSRSIDRMIISNTSFGCFCIAFILILMFVMMMLISQTFNTLTHYNLGENHIISSDEFHEDNQNGSAIDNCIFLLMTSEKDMKNEMNEDNESEENNSCESRESYKTDDDDDDDAVSYCLKSILDLYSQDELLQKVEIARYKAETEYILMQMTVQEQQREEETINKQLTVIMNLLKKSNSNFTKSDIEKQYSFYKR